MDQNVIFAGNKDFYINNLAICRVFKLFLFFIVFQREIMYSDQYWNKERWTDICHFFGYS